MKNTYLFYDIESTGLNPCFDQVLQFAAIRTDMELNELERHEIRIKLNPDIIPAPMAMLTHMQSIEIMQQGVDELTGIQKIHALMNAPGTISLGYNTLGFDDEFLRFSFFRNLLPPYTHQYSQSCYRMDLYPIVTLFYLFKPDTLKWPTVDGRVSLKLDNINHLNGLAEGMAHDAMVDVRATLALAKLCKQDSAMWNYCLGYFKKETDQQRLNQLHYRIEINRQHYPLAYACYGRFGAGNNFVAPVIALGNHNVYKNQSLWLRLDLPKLQQCNGESIFDNTFVLKKKPAENILILPYHDRYHSLLSAERQQTTKENINWCTHSPELFQQIKKEHRAFTYPTVEHVDPDAALYQLPFSTREQQQLMQKFHDAKPNHKLSVLEQINCPVLLELGLRILAKHIPQLLDNHHREHFNDQVSRVFQSTHSIIDHKNQLKLNSKAALQEISELESKFDLHTEKLQLLEELKGYILTKKNTLI